MYPLTIGLAIENRELWDQAQATLADLPFRIIVEHQDVGDVSNFLDRLERMRPDVVLVDVIPDRLPQFSKTAVLVPAGQECQRMNRST